MELIVTEGVEGYWHYHLSEAENFTKSLCGKSVMKTALPLSGWGRKTFLNEKYCSECEKVKDSA